MLKQVADGVLVHESEFVQSNAVVVPGRSGVLLIDPGVQDHEMACLADDLSAVGQTVVAGFSTHPDWDHVLWHPRLGAPPRYGTAACADSIGKQMSAPNAKAEIYDHLVPAGIADRVPLDLIGLVTGLPANTAEVPWDGPRARILEHRAHAPGHAALLLEEHGVLVAGDMLSDVLVPMVDFDAADPLGDYLAALELLARRAGHADAVVPGHGSVGGPGAVRSRIERDKAYILALQDGREPDDPRIGSSARPGWEWVTDVHDGQRKRLSA